MPRVDRTKPLLMSSFDRQGSVFELSTISWSSRHQHISQKAGEPDFPTQKISRQHPPGDSNINVPYV